MKVEWKKAIRASWAFALKPKKFLIYFAFSIVSLAVLSVPALLWTNQLTSLTKITQSPGLPLTSMIAFLAAVIIIILVGLLLSSVFIHNYSTWKRKDSLSESLKFIEKRYASIVGVFVILFAITWLLSLPTLLVQSYADIISSIISLAIYLLFFFVYQEVVLDKRNAVDSLKSSLALTKKLWKEVLITFLLSIVLSIGIIALFGIPLIATVLLAGLTPITIGQLIIPLIISGIILILGTAVSKLFGIAIITDVYMQLKRR